MRALAAELVRWRRSAGLRLPLFALAAGLLEGLLFVISPDAHHTWQGLELWHTLWVSFAGPLALALLCGLTARREALARGGGTWWRPVPLARQHLASFILLALASLVMDVLALLSAFPFGLTAQVHGPVPLARTVELAAVLWFTGLPALAIFDGVARRLGLVATMLAGLVGAGLGVLPAEGPFWWASPFAWSVRAAIPVLGDHASGVALAPGSPLRHLPLWPMLALTVVATPALIWWAGRRLPGTLRLEAVAPLGRERRYIRTRPYRASTLRSRLVAQRRTVLPWVTVLAPLVVGAAGLRYGAPAAWQLWTLLVLPFGAALLPALVWTRERSAWRILRTRPVRPQSLLLALLGVLWACALLAAVVLGLLMLAEGMPLLRLLRLFLLDAGLSLALLTFELWLAVRLGSGVALGAGALGTLLGLLLGGTGLGARIWPAVPWTWGWMAQGSTATVLGFTGLSLLLGAVFAWLATRAATR